MAAFADVAEAAVFYYFRRIKWKAFQEKLHGKLCIYDADLIATGNF